MKPIQPNVFHDPHTYDMQRWMYFARHMYACCFAMDRTNEQIWNFVMVNSKNNDNPSSGSFMQGLPRIIKGV